MGYKECSLFSLSFSKWGKTILDIELYEIAHLLNPIQAFTWLLQNLGDQSRPFYLKPRAVVLDSEKGHPSQTVWSETGRVKGVVSDARTDPQTGTTRPLVRLQIPFHSSFVCSGSLSFLCPLWATAVPCANVHNGASHGKVMSHSPMGVPPQTVTSQRKETVLVTSLFSMPTTCLIHSKDSMNVYWKTESLGITVGKGVA